MAAPIGPGDWVECTDSATAMSGDTVVAGQLYMVAVVGQMPRGCSRCGCGVGILLTTDSCHDGKWCSGRFRPIYRPKSEIIEALKAPVTRTPQVVRDGSREEVS